MLTYIVAIFTAIGILTAIACGGTTVIVEQAPVQTPMAQSANSGSETVNAPAPSNASPPASVSKQVPATETTKTEDCLIKGNISAGQKIYHTQDSQWYDRTEIDAAAGERWFCTEEEAQAAGWSSPARAGGSQQASTSAASNAPAGCERTVNINTAESGELKALPGVGDAIAQRIIDYRNEQGEFSSVEQLTNVKGIGDKTMEKIRPCAVLR